MDIRTFGHNKCIAHNALAVPVLTPTFGLLEWSIAELESLDVKTRKLLTSTGNLHRNADVDRLYIPRSEGGRDLKSVYTAFKARIVSLYHHLQKSSPSNIYLRHVLTHEQDGICLVASQLTHI